MFSATLLQLLAVQVLAASAALSTDLTATYSWNGNEYLLVKIGKTWNESRDFCRQRWGQGNGDLVIINDPNENKNLHQFLQNHNTDYPYIGGSDIKQEGTWIWVDDCPIIYKNFNDNQPDDHDKNEDCLHIHKSSGKWNDISCNTKLAFICERKRYGESCNAATHSWNGNEYLLVKIGRTWNESRDFCCENWGQGNGDLVIINDANENTNLHQFLQNHNVDYPYIGGSDIKQEGTWTWVDDCPIIYKNFNDNQPDDHDKNEDCLHIHKSSGKWNDISCNMKRTFICERKRHGESCNDSQMCNTLCIAMSCITTISLTTLIVAILMIKYKRRVTIKSHVHLNKIENVSPIQKSENAHLYLSVSGRQELHKCNENDEEYYSDPNDVIYNENRDK